MDILLTCTYKNIINSALGYFPFPITIAHQYTELLRFTILL